MNKWQEDLIKEWVLRLGLTDWRIKFEVDLDQEDMETDDADGCSIYEESIKAATIQISKPDNDESRLRPYNFEETLIHELLHLKFSFIQSDDPNSLQDRIVHQLIDDLARTFVQVKYSKPVTQNIKYGHKFHRSKNREDFKPNSNENSEAKKLSTEHKETEFQTNSSEK